MLYWIGQAFGMIATVSGISIPLFKKKWQMLVMNIVNNLSSALSLVFLDRIGSGIFLFAAATAQALVNLAHSLRNTKGRAIENTVFLLLYLFLGFYGLFTAPGFVPAVNARNLLELLPIAGAVLSMCFISARRESLARIFFVGCGGVWSIYYAVIGSASFFGTFFSVVTGVIAMYKNRREQA